MLAELAAVCGEARRHEYTARYDGAENVAPSCVPVGSGCLPRVCFRRLASRRVTSHPWLFSPSSSCKLRSRVASRARKLLSFSILPSQTLWRSTIVIVERLKSWLMDIVIRTNRQTVVTLVRKLLRLRLESKTAPRWMKSGCTLCICVIMCRRPLPSAPGPRVGRRCEGPRLSVRLRLSAPRPRDPLRTRGYLAGAPSLLGVWVSQAKLGSPQKLTASQVQPRQRVSLVPLQRQPAPQPAPCGA